VKTTNNSEFTYLFRNSAPYINAFRGRTFVIVFSGDALLDDAFDNLVHDFALLHSLGIRLVLVHGARPQIEQRLALFGVDVNYANNIRITDDTALQCVKDAVGSTRCEIEALLSMGLANSPMAGARLRVVSGNFVTAKPYGVRDGIDYLHTGEIRRIDNDAITDLLDRGNIVLLSPIAYSPTGEIFNVTAESVASNTAVALHADKLIYLTEKLLLQDNNQTIRELSLKATKQYLATNDTLYPHTRNILQSAAQVCENGVHRVHIVNRNTDGALLQELFTRDGIGTLISVDEYEGTRAAKIEDVPGILELIKPMEQLGILVRRSRERLEMEISNFVVVERDGMIVACAASYTFDETDIAELACLAVHSDYQDQGRGETLLNYIENTARQNNIKQLFVLSTRTMHWFQERGFSTADINTLPIKRKTLYNYQRNSKVFIKSL